MIFQEMVYYDDKRTASAAEGAQSCPRKRAPGAEPQQRAPPATGAQCRENRGFLAIGQGQTDGCGYYQHPGGHNETFSLTHIVLNTKFPYVLSVCLPLL